MNCLETISFRTAGCGNAFCGIEDEESWTVEYGKMYENRTEVIEGFRSLIDGIGSGFVPDGDLMELYKAQRLYKEI